MRLLLDAFADGAPCTCGVELIGFGVVDERGFVGQGEFVERDFFLFDFRDVILWVRMTDQGQHRCLGIDAGSLSVSLEGREDGSAVGLRSSEDGLGGRHGDGRSNGMY